MQNSLDFHLFIADYRVGQLEIHEEVFRHYNFIGISHTDACRDRAVGLNGHCLHMNDITDKRRAYATDRESSTD